MNNHFCSRFVRKDKFVMSNRNKIIKARVTEEEAVLVKTKAEYYGYKSLSKYLNDSAIYEKVTYVNIKNQEKIYAIYAQNTKELNKFVKEIRNITKYMTSIDKLTIQSIKSLMFSIIKNQRAILKSIDKKLDLDVWQQINR